jgi:uncharacterized iron-regulated membrane protein
MNAAFRRPTAKSWARPGQTESRQIAALFAGRPVTAIDRIERDQWTVAGGFNRHRPLWKAAIDGPGGHIIYVSSQTGAVVLDTDARERFWNWLGSVPHWIYPTVIRQDNAVWRQVVMWVSGPCIVGAVTGMWIGILRTRLGRRRFRGGRTTPYHGWMEWHHWTGLIGGLFLLAWIFSGWLSVDPFRLFASPGIGDAERIAYDGSAPMPALALPLLAEKADGARRVTLYRAAGRPLLSIERQDGQTGILDAASLAPARLDPPALIDAARLLMPNVPIVAVERLTAPDAYWYEVGARPTLPVLRVRFGDPAATWVHIDPASGRLLGDMDRRRRVYRWAFDLLHKWDLKRPHAPPPGMGCAAVAGLAGGARHIHHRHLDRHQAAAPLTRAHVSPWAYLSRRARSRPGSRNRAGSRPCDRPAGPNPSGKAVRRSSA